MAWGWGEWVCGDGALNKKFNAPSLQSLTSSIDTCLPKNYDHRLGF